MRAQGLCRFRSEACLGATFELLAWMSNKYISSDRKMEPEKAEYCDALSIPRMQDRCSTTRTEWARGSKIRNAVPCPVTDISQRYIPTSLQLA